MNNASLFDALSNLRLYPVHLMLVLSAPLLALAAWKKIYPSQRLVVLVIVPTLLTIGVLVRRDALPVVLLADVLLYGLAVFDATRIAPRTRFEVQRDGQKIASLNKSHRVTLTISNRGPRGETIFLRDGVPPVFETTPVEFNLILPARSRVTVHYELKPKRRGAFVLPSVHLKVASRWGWWYRYFAFPLESPINVYPDMKQLSEYALLARTNRLTLLGVRRTRRVGQDNEFERLRDYTLDDNYKHIDWRSTARRNKLIVKDFQTNQSQRVIFVLDCGRMMTNEAAGNSLLDHSLNAMLMLSYVALSRGDSVGLVTFSDEIHASVPARNGLSQMNHLLHAVYDRFPRLVESRYEEAFLHISSQFRKRSLVVLITNVIDEVNARQIHEYLKLFKGRHLPVAVLLRDQHLFQAVEEGARSHVYRAAAAAEILLWRHQVIRDLKRQGVLVVDVEPESMTAPLINQYLEIKARHLL